MLRLGTCFSGILPAWRFPTDGLWYPRMPPELSKRRTSASWNFRGMQISATAKGSSPVKEYDIFIPLTYNDGKPVEGRKLVRLRERLLEEFGGVTFFPQSNEGFWTFGDVTYRDEIVIYRV